MLLFHVEGMRTQTVSEATVRLCVCFQGCHNREPQGGWPKRTETDSRIVPGTEGLAGSDPSGGPGEECFLASSSF